MKSKEEIKAELHQKIDNIEDEHILNVLNEDIVPYAAKNRSKKNDEEVDNLTADEEKELDEAINEVNNGETVSWNQFLNATVF